VRRQLGFGIASWNKPNKEPAFAGRERERRGAVENCLVDS